MAEYEATVESWLSTTVLRVTASRCKRSVVAQAEIELQPYLRNRQSLLSNAIPLQPIISEALLEQGILSHSQIGSYCPVNLKLNDKLIAKCGTEFPTLFQDQVYYPNNKLSQDQFLSNPIFFQSEIHYLPVLYPTCCILGGPKSGKSSLAKALAIELNSVHLTVASILQALLDGEENTSLFESVRISLTEDSK